ncbi:MAG TPA: hypothetical protein VNJ51_06990 [Candidatus Dormibacteraeota bacterium]|nr:hypothetical protein [Candidatus Dormibacteraeota bacterium]
MQGRMARALRDAAGVVGVALSGAIIGHEMEYWFLGDAHAVGGAYHYPLLAAALVTFLFNVRRNSPVARRAAALPWLLPALQFAAFLGIELGLEHHGVSAPAAALALVFQTLTGLLLAIALPPTIEALAAPHAARLCAQGIYLAFDAAICPPLSRAIAGSASPRAPPHP